MRSTTYISALYGLQSTGYTGWRSMDQHAYRDVAAAIRESIAWLGPYPRFVDECGAETSPLPATGDAVATPRFLPSVLTTHTHESCA